MATLNINPTAMELKNLRKKLNIATRGHKLLKDKRDELMRRFLDIAKENDSLRTQVENELKDAQFHMSIALSLMTSQQVETALMMPKQEVNLNIEYKSITGVTVPLFKAEYKVEDKTDIYPYGYAFTSGELDKAVEKFGSVFEKMIRLAQVEKSCQLMADEIEKTRRRVNALEYVVIPEYRETIRYITMKIEENERSTIARLMKIKPKPVRFF